MFLGTSNLIVICKVQTEILRRKLISNKGTKNPEAIQTGLQIYEELQAVTFFHLSDLTHDNHSLFTWILKSLVMKAAQFPGNLCSSTLLYCRVFLLLLTQQMRLLSLPLTHQQKDQTPTPSPQRLLTLLKIYISLQSYHLR